jgi:hypothetical protein
MKGASEMQKSVVGQPVRGANDRARQLALVVASRALDEARENKRRREAKALIPEARNALSRALETERSQTAEVAQLKQDAESVLNEKPSLVEASLMLRIAVFNAGFWIIGIPTRLVPFGIIAGVGALFILASLKKKRVAEREARRNTLIVKSRSVSQSLEQTRTTIAAARTRIEELEQASMGHFSPAFGRVCLYEHPYRLITCLERTVLIDASPMPIAPMVQATLPDLSGRQAAFEGVRAALAEARAKPVLLSPGGVQAGATGLDALHGEERTLRGAIEGFVALANKDSLQSRLPLVPADAPIAEYIKDKLAKREYTEVRTSESAQALLPEIAASLRRLEDIAAANDETDARDAEQTLRDTRSELAGLLGDYRDLREHAIASLHTEYDKVVENAALAYVRHYCPKCNRVPAFLYGRIGLNPETAHELTSQELFGALRRSTEAGERMSKDATLMPQFMDGWLQLKNLRAALDEQSDLVGALEDPDSPESQKVKQHFDNTQLQHDLLLHYFRSKLNFLVIGLEQPQLDLSREAVLHIDPLARTWRCNACSTTFEQAEADLGRMLRIKDELLMPMWNHLWAEKDDFRKAELFRTNEQLQRLVEKEVAALRDVAEQYRADMRPVRENLLRSASDAGTSLEKLSRLIESMRRIDSISPEAAHTIMSGVRSDTPEVGEAKRQVEDKETHLMMLPQAVFKVRAPELDPTQRFQSPSTLFATTTDNIELAPIASDRRRNPLLTGQP